MKPQVNTAEHRLSLVAEGPSLIWEQILTGSVSVDLCSSVVPIIFVLVPLLGCAAIETPATPTESAETTIIRERVDQSVTALNTADVETLLALHTDDAVILKPHQRPEVGKQVMRSSLEALFRQFEVEESREISEVQVAGEWAFVWGTYRSTLTPRSGGAPSEETGKYIEVLRKPAAGGWKFARTIWNTSDPQP